MSEQSSSKFRTLSPMNFFSSELGLQFGTTLEAPHVIDVESQVWPAVISTGLGNLSLNASSKTADGYTFQDALGKSFQNCSGRLSCVLPKLQADEETMQALAWNRTMVSVVFASNVYFHK